MFREARDMTVEFRSAMRGGTGDVTIKHIFKPEELKGKARLLAEITLPPGSSIGLHQHDQEEEVYYFISGQGRVTDDGTEREVGPGDAVLTGGGKEHAVCNTGAEPLVFMAVILLYV